MTIHELVLLSAKYGADPLWIQGAGGNVSCKISPTAMIIKASGYCLGEVKENRGWVEVDHAGIKTRLGEIVAQEKPLHQGDQELNTAIDQHTRPLVDGAKVASIETGMHVLLKKYVCHTHPVLLNVLMCARNSKELVLTLFDQKLAHVWLDFTIPGFQTAAELSSRLTPLLLQGKTLPEVIFLAGHGLVVHADSLERVDALQQKVVLKAKEFLASRGYSGEPFLKPLNIGQYLDIGDLYPDVVVFAPFLEDALAGKLGQKGQQVLAVFNGALRVRQIAELVGIELLPLPQKAAAYIRAMEREKRRQTI